MKKTLVDVTKRFSIFLESSETKSGGGLFRLGSPARSR